MTDYNSIGKSYPLIDAADKATGKYRYLSDVRLPGMLWGKVLRSPKPHALIKKIDISEAEKLPGVKAVITGADIPGILCGPFMPDWNILPAKKVTFVGQEVAAVAATSLETAEKAISLIKVTYEDLPAVFDPEEAMKFDAPIVPEAKHSNIAYEFDVSVGDVDKAFQESDYVKELTFSTSSAFHAYLEPNGSVASYDPVANTYTIWAATQVPYKARLLYSRALGIEMKDLRLIQANMGGAFGGKFESNLHLVNLYLAKKAGQPVRLVNSMEEEFFTATLRVPMKITVKVGIKKDGTIMAKDTHIVADNGARTNYGPASVSTACYRVDSLYRIKNTRSKGYLVYTNNVPKGAMRGFGNPQMLLALEAVLDMLAEESGLDPGEIRLKNCFKAGEESVHGWKIGSCGLPECIAEAKELSHWDEKRKKDNFSKCQRLRGIGLACCNHVSGYRPILKDFDGSSALVKVGPDGKAIVFSGEVDIGQGYRTIAAQCAAEELGIPLEYVEVADVDSQTSVLGIGSLASRGTVMGGNAVVRAAADAKEKILHGIEGLLNKASGTIKITEGKFVDQQGEILGTFSEMVRRLCNAHSGEPIMGSGYYYPDTVIPDPITKFGNTSPAYPFGAHVAEVEIDMETGKVTVVNYAAVNDVGKVINPMMAVGQLAGGVLQGIGWVLSENLVVLQGKIVNPNLLDYKIPTMADMVETNTGLVEAPDDNGPYGAKSLGEAALDPVAAAVCNAISHALGTRITKIPVLEEDILAIIKKKYGTQGGEGCGCT